MTKTGNEYTLLGFPLLRFEKVKAQYRFSYKIKLFKIFMIAIGYSEFNGDNIHIELGITKLQLFTSFTIRRSWFV